MKRLLHEYSPKKTYFKKVQEKEVNIALVELNNRLRKKLNDQQPAKMMAEHMAALAALIVMQVQVESATLKYN